VRFACSQSSCIDIERCYRGDGWWSVKRFGSPLVSIATTVSENGPRMPPRTTVVHDLLQIVTVALGSPLGRRSRRVNSEQSSLRSCASERDFREGRVEFWLHVALARV